MRNKELEGKLRRAYSHAAPDVLDSVLSSCEDTKDKVIVMTEQKKRSPWIRRGMGIAAALVLLLGGAAGVRLYSVNRAVASTVSLDVNPSVEIQVNQKDRVLRVNALNEDGRIVLGDMNFSGSSLDVTVNALVGSMLRNGYLSELANSILVSVDNGDPAKGAALQTRLTEEINSLLQTDAFTGAVLSQTVSADGTLEKLADTYGISLGKAQLIREIADKNPLYTPEDLAKLTINELNLLASAGSGALDKVESVGTASDKAYIGADKARDAALRHAGVTAADAAKLEVELSCEKGVMVYEVEFEAGGYEYDVDVNAKTGDILKSEKERDDDEPTATRPASGTTSADPGAVTAPLIGEAKAKEIALKNAGVTAGSLIGYAIELDTENGVMVYEVEFKAGGYEYDYDIDAKTGKILKRQKERDDDRSSAAGTAALIGSAKAKEIALSHAAVSADGLRDIAVDLDDKDGAPVYEVEFKSGGYAYDYDIDAKTGKILKNEKEQDD